MKSPNNLTKKSYVHHYYYEIKNNPDYYYAYISKIKGLATSNKCKYILFRVEYHLGFGFKKMPVLDQYRH